MATHGASRTVNGLRFFEFVISRERAAQERSRSLLIDNLPNVQAMKYQVFDRFYVVGGLTGDVYYIRNGFTILNESRKERCCLIARNTSFPAADIMLAKKLMIECEEDKFLLTANAFPTIKTKMILRAHVYRARKHVRAWARRIRSGLWIQKNSKIE